MEKILIVEDDKEIGKLLSEGFSSHGYKCYIVSSLSEVILIFYPLQIYPLLYLILFFQMVMD